MAYLETAVRSSLLLLGAAVLLTGCPDDPITPQDDTGSTGDSATDTGGTCEPGQTQTCPCPDGSDGMRECLASGAGFSPCDCSSETLDTGMTTNVDGSTSTGSESSDGPPPECTTNEDCPSHPRECFGYICNENGECVEDFVQLFGTPCGDPTTDECTNPDTCDDGVCVPNHVADGLTCSTCAEGQCTCAGGSCGSCNAFAATNNFITSRSIEGWELTGDWALRREAPQSELQIQSEFPGQVLGTDGNRTSPYPGSEIETSYARTPPVVLPATIAFLSWHIDEGGGSSDNKTVRVSVDGGASWQTLADCAMDNSPVFCTPVTQADPGVWFLAQIPVPAPLQGLEGIVEFGYDTVDSCCNFEKGWYIDSLNVATECRCSDDANCSDLSTTCGTGICLASGECGLSPMPDDTLCGDPFENDCNGADLCDGVGYCRENLAATGLALCGDCPGGMGCSFCDQGQCLDCNSFTDFSDFSDPLGVAGWQITSITGTSDWGLYNEAPPNSNPGSLPLPFPNAPVYGTDGNRNPPYPGSEQENSQVITSVGVVGSEITFISWNVDEGSFFDTKRIDLSVDGGVTWNNLVDCQIAATQPFCDFVDDTRAPDDWDFITLNTAMWAGQAGQLRFSYNTGDSCCGFERGWFIDDLSFAAFCDDEPFPPGP